MSNKAYALENHKWGTTQNIKKKNITKPIATKLMLRPAGEKWGLIDEKKKMTEKGYITIFKETGQEKVKEEIEKVNDL